MKKFVKHAAPNQADDPLKGSDILEELQVRSDTPDDIKNRSDNR